MKDFKVYQASGVLTSLVHDAAYVNKGRELPEDYTELSYLTNPNGAYIDTGINIDNGCKIKIKFLRRPRARTNAVIFGWRYGGTFTDGQQLYINYNNTSNVGSISAGWKLIVVGVASDASVVGSTACFTPDQDETVIIDSANEKVFVNGEEISINSNFSNGFAFDSDGTSGVHPYLFALNNVGSESVISLDTRIYLYEVTKNNRLIQKMIPCIDPNGIYGMYDTVSETFFGSANEYSFSGA